MRASDKTIAGGGWQRVMKRQTQLQSRRLGARRVKIRTLRNPDVIHKCVTNSLALAARWARRRLVTANKGQRHVLANVALRSRASSFPQHTSSPGNCRLFHSRVPFVLSPLPPSLQSLLFFFLNDSAQPPDFRQT